MSKFILVHDATQSASPVLVAVDKIITVVKSEIFIGTSEILLDIASDDTREDYLTVTETPEQIFEMLKS